MRKNPFKFVRRPLKAVAGKLRNHRKEENLRNGNIEEESELPTRSREVYSQESESINNNTEAGGDLPKANELHSRPTIFGKIANKIKDRRVKVTRKLPSTPESDTTQPSDDLPSSNTSVQSAEKLDPVTFIEELEELVGQLEEGKVEGKVDAKTSYTEEDIPSDLSLQEQGQKDVLWCFDFDQTLTTEHIYNLAATHACSTQGEFYALAEQFFQDSIKPELTDQFTRKEALKALATIINNGQKIAIVTHSKFPTLPW